jgi:hypothetical protein
LRGLFGSELACSFLSFSSRKTSLLLRSRSVLFEDVARASLCRPLPPLAFVQNSTLTTPSRRYVVRLLGWARKYGIRVNLDLHTAPGSQNGVFSFVSLCFVIRYSVRVASKNEARLTLLLGVRVFPSARKRDCESAGMLVLSSSPS